MKEAKAKWDIRAERPEDAPLVDALNASSFGPGRFARAAFRLREGVSPDTKLSFVAVEKGQLRGCGTARAREPNLLVSPPARKRLSTRSSDKSIWLIEINSATISNALAKGPLRSSCADHTR